MPKLNTYIEIVEYGSEKPTEIYLPDVDDMFVTDNTVVDCTDEVTTELCEVMMKDGTSYFINCSMAFAIDLYKDIMRFKLAEVMGVRTDKLYIH